MASLNSPMSRPEATLDQCGLGHAAQTASQVSNVSWRPLIFLALDLSTPSRQILKPLPSHVMSWTIGSSRARFLRASRKFSCGQKFATLKCSSNHNKDQHDRHQIDLSKHGHKNRVS